MPTGMSMHPRAHAEVLLASMSHALTTESEEIMGLLLGDIEVRQQGLRKAEPPLQILMLQTLARGKHSNSSAT
eukprot:366442-Chlamydomonas_euryale.AAC.21